METLHINNNTSKNDIIKQVNKFRLKNKNKWFQVEIEYVPYTYKLKCFNTWVQLMYKCENNKVICNLGSDMDISVKDFKEHLNIYIE